MIGECVINTIKDNKYQIELLAGETRDEIELMQHFGYKSIPPQDTKGLTVSVAGMRDNTIIIATSNENAPELKEGETAVFSNFESFVKLLEDGVVNINGDSKNFVTYAELDSALQKLVTTYNSHTHLTPVYMPLPVPVTPIPTPPPTVPATLDISASKTKKVFTS